MKKSVIGIGCIYTLVFSIPAFAQYGSDIFRYSEINQTGSARFQAIGGNHAALGADPSNISGNPAGLGFYNRSEFSISPTYTNINTQTSYLGQTSTVTSGNAGISQASLVITSQPNFERKWKRTSMGISYSRQQSFRNKFNYKGLNSKSAYVDKVVEDANGVGWTPQQYDNEYNTNGNNYYYLDEAYFGLQMIYPTSNNGTTYTRDDKDKVTRQDGMFESKGSQSQWTIAYGGNYDDKLYVGGSVGFTGIKYSFLHSLQETYVNGTVFRSSDLDEDFTVRSNGVNATFGLIYKISPLVQFGGSVSTPTFAKISKENFNQSVSADYIKGSITDDNGKDIGPVGMGTIVLAPNEFQYSMVGPFRGSGGVTLFLGKKGFITGTLEYVCYSGMRANTDFLQTSQANEAFKTSTKADVKDLYKNVVNARIGGEYRAGIWRGRLGFAYLADPYRLSSDNIKRDRLLFSAGLGIRKERFFVDLSGTVSSFKSVYNPYILNNEENYSSASITNTHMNFVLTVGTSF